MMAFSVKIALSIGNVLQRRQSQRLSKNLPKAISIASWLSIKLYKHDKNVMQTSNIIYIVSTICQYCFRNCPLVDFLNSFRSVYIMNDNGLMRYFYYSLDYRWRTVKGAVKRTRAVSFDQRRSAMSVHIRTKATRFVLEFCLSSGKRNCYTACKFGVRSLPPPPHKHTKTTSTSRPSIHKYNL